ncbi:universal stress protein UspA [Halomonas sp. ZH2S]|uniref:Universal stress protein UspA n=1 Tax=Vreelandella zhuhanensis TaxID=2684210 RepID=A0A7X3H2H4_9GAMM|nr:universal stress protein [Halomonas zhuhanensis]MWJ29019.1 universal stress protein UspA [Halomonas zhuhanensis]
MKRFKNILFVLGNRTDETSPSLMRAIALAKTNQADLTLLYVLPKLSLTSYSKKMGISSQQLKEKVQEHEEARLHQLFSSLEPDLGIRTELKVGKRYLESIRAVQSESFDLVIKEADAIDWFSRFLGSDDMHLLRKCPCPVWLMKKDEKADYRNIMAAVDFDTGKDKPSSDALNQTILDLACSLSLSELAAVHAVNVYDVPESGFISLWVENADKVEQELAEDERRHRQYRMDALLDELKGRMGEETYHYLSLRTHVVPGIPGRDLPKMVETIKADLVVMGTVARTGVAGVIIGNTAEAVLSQLNCSVLAIKPKGFESPIF